MTSINGNGGYVARLPDGAPLVLSESTVLVQNPHEDFALVQSEELTRIQILVARLMKQLLNGCQSQSCNNTACHTFQKRIAEKPVRKLSPVSARATALHLASQDYVDQYLCKDMSGMCRLASGNNQAKVDAKSLKREDLLVHSPATNLARKHEAPEASQVEQVSQRSSLRTASEARKDPKSFSQYIFENFFMKSLDLSQVTRSNQSHHQYLSPFRPQSLTSISWDVQYALSSMDSNNFRRRWSWNGEHVEPTATVEDNQMLLFLKQSCFHVFSFPENLLASFRTDEEESYDFTRIRKTLAWWYAKVGDILLISLRRTLERFEPFAQTSGTEILSKDLKATDLIHVMRVCIFGLLSSSPTVLETDEYKHPTQQKLRSIDSFLNPASIQLAKRVIHMIFNLYWCYNYNYTKSNMRLVEVFVDLRHSVKVNLNLKLGLRHWARIVFQTEWDGEPMISRKSCAGEALDIIEWLYTGEMDKARAFEPYYMFPLADYLDSIDVVNQIQGKADKESYIHILDFPWLFPRTSIFENFRALCLVRMMNAVDKGELVLQILCNRSVNYFQDDLEPRRILGTASSRNLALFVRRESLLTDTFDQLWRREVRELLRPLKVKIEQFGEQGIDEGGVAQEYLRLVFAEACRPDYGLFVNDASTRMMWFNPDCREKLWRFEVLGILVALAVYNGFTLPFTFPKVMYRKLLGIEVNDLASISDGWPELAHGLEALLNWTDGDVGDIFMRTYEFSYEACGKVVHIDIRFSRRGYERRIDPSSGGYEPMNETTAPLVTNANRKSYVEDYIDWLINESVQHQYEAFQKGFLTILDREMIKNLRAEDLQILIEGHHEIDIQRLCAVTRYEGYSGNSTIVKWFWSIANTYSQQQKGKLLQFVMATDRIPVLGYQSIEFVIQKNGPDSEQLPSSHTCFGRLLLPEYSSEEKLREKLRIALDNSIGFGLS